MSENNLKTILHAFSSLDINTLGKYLKDECFYLDTKKKIFLRELERVFNRHKDAGDTKLLIYEGKCIDINSSQYYKKRIQVCR